MQPVAFRVGLPGQRAQVDRQGLRAAHQRGERGRAERGIRVAVARSLRHVRHQARVRGQRRVEHRLVEPRAAVWRTRFLKPGGEPAYRAKEGLRDGGADLVERGNGRVHGPRPASQVLGPRGVPLRRRCVVPVVAGQVEFGEVQDRVTAVQFEIGEGDPQALLRRGQLRLVVRVADPLAVGARRREPGQPRADARGGQVLQLAVVLVPAALAYLGDVEVADRAQPRG